MYRRIMHHVARFFQNRRLFEQPPTLARRFTRREKFDNHEKLVTALEQARDALHSEIQNCAHQEEKNHLTKRHAAVCRLLEKARQQSAASTI